MKNSINYLLVFFLFQASCVSKPFGRDFDPKSKVQTVQVAPRLYVYAQEDQALNSTLTKALADMNKDWDKELSRSRMYANVHLTAFIAQLASLALCFSTDDKDKSDGYNKDALAWCGASIGFGLISIPFAFKYYKLKHKVITEYNSRY